MGCAITYGHKWVKSKKFEISTCEEAAIARGMTVDKLYRKLPKLLEYKRTRQPVDMATQIEVSVLLDFPIEYFYHTSPIDQRQIVFMCGSSIKVCAFCGHIAEYYCDAPIGDGRTCDLPLCREHKYHRPDIGTDIDYCPHHRR